MAGNVSEWVKADVYRPITEQTTTVTIDRLGKCL